LVKLLGYGVVAGATIVKVPQILKIIKKKSTFGVSFASVTLEVLSTTI
jgi:mannose-P-dolichol utilization defect protein 1